jgi:Bardet-Biedl syndrome 2 protein
MHTPHQRSKKMGSRSRNSPIHHHLNVTSSADSDITLLSFGQHITALAAGKLDQNSPRDSLLIGSQTNLLVYDVEKNSELYYKDVSF